MLSPPNGYTAVDTDSEKGELDSFLEKSPSIHPKQSRWPYTRLLSLTPWLLLVIMTALSAFLLLERRSQHAPFGTYETGFTSDLCKDYRL